MLRTGRILRRVKKRALRVHGALVNSLLMLGLVPSLSAAEALPPPFGLAWGDSPTRLVDWAVRTKLDQTVKAPAEKPRLKILMISAAKGALPGHDASVLEARFMDGQLFEVALHYSYPGRKADFVRGQFVELKGILTRRHGAFKPSGNLRDSPRDGIITRSTAYQNEPATKRSLLLVLTEVTDAKRGDAAARFSVVYHSDGVVEDEGPRVIIRRDGVDLPDGPIAP